MDLHLTEHDVEKLVAKAIDRLSTNPLGLRLRENGVHKVDGRWWAFLELAREPESQSEIWAAVAKLEGILQDEMEVSVSVTAA